MEYTLEIYGYSWEGRRCVYSYRIEQAQALALQGPNPEPRRLAGDFESVIDWRLVSCQSTYEGNRTIKRGTDRYKTIRGFRNGMSPRRFYRLANGV
jgi:hypothetical protein